MSKNKRSTIDAQRDANRATPPQPPDRERLEWLLAFMHRDLTTLRPGERLDLADDVRRYLSPFHIRRDRSETAALGDTTTGMRRQQSRPAAPLTENDAAARRERRRREDTGHGRWLRARTVETETHPPMPSPTRADAVIEAALADVSGAPIDRLRPRQRVEGSPYLEDAGEDATSDAQRDVTLKTLQADLLLGVDLLKRGSAWTPFGDRPRFVQVAGEPRLVGGPAPSWVLTTGPDGAVEWAFEGDLQTVLIAQATTILMRWWPHLRTCAYNRCGVLFLPRHKGRHYHDDECSRRARWEKFAPTRKKRDYKEEFVRRELRDGPRSPSRTSPEKKAARQRRGKRTS